MNSRNFIVTIIALCLFVSTTMEVGAQVGRIGPPDNVRQEIEAKARALDLGRATYDIIEATRNTGGIRAWYQPYERGTVYSVPGYGVLWMSNAMELAYRGDPFTRMTHAL